MKHLSWRGYTIQFAGSVSLHRPLLPAQTAYLQRFLSTRRVGWRVEQVQEMANPLREAVGLSLGAEGAYFTGLSREDLDYATWKPLGLNQNKPPQGQPQLWCAWRLAEDGMTLHYVGQKHELYYCSAWLQYLIEHFFTRWGYTLTGKITWQGDDDADRGAIIVKDCRIEPHLFQVAGRKNLVQPNQPIGCVHRDALETKLVCAHIANLFQWLPHMQRDSS